jgi:hypothetical protein
MRFIRLMRDGFTVYSENLTTFILAMLCAAVGSIFIVTAPPLLFGLYSMGLKAAKGRSVEVKDLLDGFRYAIKSWVYVILVLLLILAGTSAAYTIVKRLGLSATASLLAVLAAFTAWTSIVLFSLIYAIPSIIEKNGGIIHGMRYSIKLAYGRFTTTILLFTSLTLLTLLIGWIPVAGPLIIIPYQITTYSKATLEL